MSVPPNGRRRASDVPWEFPKSETLGICAGPAACLRASLRRMGVSRSILSSAAVAPRDSCHSAYYCTLRMECEARAGAGPRQARWQLGAHGPPPVLVGRTLVVRAARPALSA